MTLMSRSVKRQLALTLAVLGAVPGTEGSSLAPATERSGIGDDFDCTYSSLYPRQYVSYKLEPGALDPSSLDGDLTKQVWAEVPWTDDFVDIATITTPKFQTRAKIRWDDQFVYVAAALEEPEAWATLTEHNDVIYNDNDFEIFVDPGGTTHYYKEFEINAFNTTWCVAKPACL